MKVAIVHYHFNLSGVTKVMAAASRCLKELNIPHVILVDSLPEGEDVEDVPLRAVTGLGYAPAKGVKTAVQLTELLRQAAREELGGDPDLWHFHNHAIGKSELVGEVVAQLAEAKQRLVLQMHDLVEDGRQQNYAVIGDTSRLYPMSNAIQYVFLNDQDRDVFVEHGLKKDLAQVMVNPVELAKDRESKAEGAPILFAPIRAIRRKNMGELVFLSGLVPTGTRIAISRAPKDKRAFGLHETWRKFASHQRLPIGFDVVGRYHPANGAASDFNSWVAHSSHFITTSTSEGFGMTFLEAAAFNKPLLGRNVPRVTKEHEKYGINSGDLYEKLLVPLDWVDVSILRQHFDTTIERNYRYLGRQLDKLTAERAFQGLIMDGWLDFGNMPEPIQQAVCERLGDPGCKSVPKVVIGERKRPAKAWLHEVLQKRESPVDPKQLDVYSEQNYGKALKSLYDELLKKEPSEVEFMDSTGVLDAHLKPERFHFLASVIPPSSTSWAQYRAVIFDIYGTLLSSPQVGIAEPDPVMDGLMQAILEQHGYTPPESPTQELHDAIMRHHEEADAEYPEVDMREIWRQILKLNVHVDLTNLVNAIEGECRPCQLMPGAAAFIRRLAHSGVSLGLLSNGQCNTLRSLGGIRDFFSPELIVMSYQQGVAKPSRELFQLMADRLACRGITPAETLFIGNDPVNDIVPAAAMGFKTALFTGDPDSFRPGNCTPDHEIPKWPQGSKARR